MGPSCDSIRERESERERQRERGRERERESERERERDRVSETHLSSSSTVSPGHWSRRGRAGPGNTGNI